jgi:hypothetical protein
MANGKKDVSIIQMHVLGFTKPLECNKETASNATMEGIAPQPKEETP